MSKFIDEINKIIIEKGSKRRSEIKKRFDDIEIECQSGHIFQISPKLIKDGKWCPACNENFSENIKKILDILDDNLAVYSTNVEIDGQVFAIIAKGLTSDIIIECDKSLENIEYIRKRIELSQNNKYRMLRILGNLIDKPEAQQIILNAIDSENQLIFEGDYQTIQKLTKENPKELQSAKIKLNIVESTVSSCTNIENLGGEILEDGFSTSIVKRSNIPVPKNILSCVFYERVSTQVQVEKRSLEVQEENLFQRAKAKNLFVKAIYIDRGISGKSVKERPALLKLLEEIKPRENVICASLSRLGRNIREMLNTAHVLTEEKHASLICTDLDIDTSTAIGRLTILNIHAVSQFERELTSERTMNTLTSLSVNRKLRSKPKYGWMKNPSKKGGEHVKHEDEQKVIEAIREYKNENPRATVAYIVRWLNEKYKGFGGKGGMDEKPDKKFRKWYHTTVKKICDDNGIIV